MPKPLTEVSSGDKMFKDAIYRHTHDNITKVNISRLPDTAEVFVAFIIYNKLRSIMVQHIQVIPNTYLKYYSIESIVLKANKLASMIDEVPEYIPDEQVKRWLEYKI